VPVSVVLTRRWANSLGTALSSKELTRRRRELRCARRTCVRSSGAALARHQRTRRHSPATAFGAAVTVRREGELLIPSLLDRGRRDSARVSFVPRVGSLLHDPAPVVHGVGFVFLAPRRRSGLFVCDTMQNRLDARGDRGARAATDLIVEACRRSSHPGRAANLCNRPNGYPTSMTTRLLRAEKPLDILIVDDMTEVYLQTGSRAAFVDAATRSNRNAHQRHRPLAVRRPTGVPRFAVIRSQDAGQSWPLISVKCVGARSIRRQRRVVLTVLLRLAYATAFSGPWLRRVTYYLSKPAVCCRRTSSPRFCESPPHAQVEAGPHGAREGPPAAYEKNFIKQTQHVANSHVRRSGSTSQPRVSDSGGNSPSRHTPARHFIASSLTASSWPRVPAQQVASGRRNLRRPFDTSV